MTNITSAPILSQDMTFMPKLECDYQFQPSISYIPSTYNSLFAPQIIKSRSANESRALITQRHVPPD